MKKNNLVKINIKSQKAFTMQDLIVALFIIILFVGIIGTTMYAALKNNANNSLTLQMTLYSVQILEDIDRISYEEAITKTGEDYKKQFDIPKDYTVDLTFSDYGEDLTNIQDVIKIVNLNISYNFLGDNINYTIHKLKIKEL